MKRSESLFPLSDLTSLMSSRTEDEVSNERRTPQLFRRITEVIVSSSSVFKKYHPTLCIITFGQGFTVFYTKMSQFETVP